MFSNSRHPLSTGSPKCFDYMLRDSLNYQFPNPDFFVRISLLVAISQNYFSGFFIYTRIKLQGIQLVFVQRNHNVTNISGTLSSDNDHISIVDARVCYGISISLQNVEFTAPEKGDRQADILFNIFLLGFGFSAGDCTDHRGRNAAAGELADHLCYDGSRGSVVLKYSAFIHGHKVAISSGF